MSTTQPPTTPVTQPEPQDEIPIGAGLDFTDPNSPLAKYYLRSSHVVATVLLVGTFIILNRVPLWHTDIWGHLAFGRATVQNGWPIATEPFCAGFSDPAAPGAYANWLSQVGFYLTYALGEKIATWTGADPLAGGTEMLRLALSLLVTLKLWLLWLAFRRLTNSPGWATAGLAVVLILNLGNLWVIRPQVIGEVGAATVLLALALPTVPRRFTFTLPLLMVVWANAHGSFLMGLALLGIGCAGRIVEFIWKNGTVSPQAIWKDDSCRRWFLVVVISISAIALQNPRGPWIYSEALALSRHPNVLMMDEWQPLQFTLGMGGHWAYAVTLLIVIGGVVLHRRWFTPTQTLLLAFLVWQPLVHQRMMVWWLMACPWIALPHYAGWWTAWRKQQETPAEPEAEDPFPASFRKTLIAAMLVFVAFMWSIPMQWVMAGAPTKVEQALSQGTPLQIARDAAQGKPPGRIFASETLADFIVWMNPQRNPTCVYTHVHLFPADHWKWCRVVKDGRPGWKEVLDKWHVDMVLVEAEKHPILRQRLQEDADWTIVLDETGDTKKKDSRFRWLVAVRKKK